jgi:hypothetical protein
VGYIKTEENFENEYIIMKTDSLKRRVRIDDESFIESK